MLKGEKAVFTISPEYGYGAAGAGGVIPGGATLLFEVELLEVRGGRPLPIAPSWHCWRAPRSSAAPHTNLPPHPFFFPRSGCKGSPRVAAVFDRAVLAPKCALFTVSA